MTQAVPILMYHSIDTESAPMFRRWTVSPARFGAHMDWLAKQNYRPMTISGLASLFSSGQRLPARTMAITFDDGLRDFLSAAVPILKRHSFPATLYVATGFIGKTSEWLQPLGEGKRPMLKWSELRTISASGIECGGHTHSHPQLDIMPSAAAFAEIQRSKFDLEDHLGCAVQTFAYPYGYASRTTRRLVQQAGFTSACRVRHALSSAGEDRFALSRIIVTGDTSVGDLQSLLEEGNLPVGPPPDRLVASGWRLARRFMQMAERVH
jgi:peptidoglycan/xylan/chitin deacetylase (PgdA/CDA1 family)